MNHTADISALSLAIGSLALAIPWLIFRFLNINLTKAMLIGFARMGVQLSLVGVYLEYVFAWDSLWVNLGWVLMMICVANFAVLNRSGLNKKVFFPYILAVFGIVVFCSILIFACFVPLEILFSSRYFIPLIGMVLGNILRFNVVCLDSFYAGICSREHEYMAYRTMGATFVEALKPFMARAYRASVSPQIATVSTMGLVALPGMMTGQILGGSSPALAIKYQIMIMLVIFVMTSLSIFLGMLFSSRAAFDSMGRLKRKSFIEKQ